MSRALLGLAAALLGAAGCMVNTRSGFSPASGVASSGASGSSAAAPDAGTASGTAGLVAPDLTNKTLDEAQAIARNAGLVTELELRELECGNTAPVAGRIDCQKPDPGTKLTRAGWIQVSIYQPRRIPNMIMRADARPAIGMTVDQAKALFKRLGHVGKVSVGTVMHYDDKCGQDRVCELENDEISIHDDLVLRLNPKLEIAPPQ